MSEPVTITLLELIREPDFNLFDFDYPFYVSDPKRKEEFEIKFIEHYLFREIGFETVWRFKMHLQALLTVRMPYYHQLYETEVEAKNINFLLNKDLKETYTKVNDNKSSSNQSSQESANSNGQLKNSSLADGVSKASLSDGYLTQTTGSSSSQSQNSTQNANANFTGKETYELISQGNIGVVSAAYLLREWREILINIDEMIINDCRDLFLQIY